MVLCYSVLELELTDTSLHATFGTVVKNAKELMYPYRRPRKAYQNVGFWLLIHLKNSK